VIEERYIIEIDKQSENVMYLKVRDILKDKVVFTFRYPPSSSLPIEDIQYALYRFFNNEPKDDKSKLLRKYALRLPGKYPRVYICNCIKYKASRIDYDSVYFEDDDPEYAMQKKSKPRYAESVEDEGTFELHECAKFCQMSYMRYIRHKEKLDIYLIYLPIYLAFKVKIDDIIRRALARRKGETWRLRIFQELIINPFKNASTVGKKYGKNEGEIRTYLKQAKDIIIQEAVRKEELKPIEYHILEPFLNIVFARKKTKLIIKNPRREDTDGVSYKESEIYGPGYMREQKWGEGKKIE